MKLRAILTWFGGCRPGGRIFEAKILYCNFFEKCLSFLSLARNGLGSRNLLAHGRYDNGLFFVFHFG